MAFTGTFDDSYFPVNTVKFYCKNRPLFYKKLYNFSWKSCQLFMKNRRKSGQLFQENFTIFLKKSAEVRRKMYKFLQENLPICVEESDGLYTNIWRFFLKFLDFPKKTGWLLCKNFSEALRNSGDFQKAPDKILLCQNLSSFNITICVCVSFLPL